jgi:hypothetical protein
MRNETRPTGLTGNDVIKFRGKVRAAREQANSQAHEITPPTSPACAYERGRRDAFDQVMTMLEEAIKYA